MVKQPGSAGLPIKFRLNEKTFVCKSEKAKAAHAQVVDESKADILGLKDPQWNKSTYVDKSRFPKHEAECKLSTTFGLEGHTVRDPDILWSRPALPGPWQASTEINRKILQKTLEVRSKGDLINTMKRSARLAEYVDPATAQSPQFRRTRSLSPAKRTCRCPDPGMRDDLSPRRSKRRSRPPRKEDVDEVRRLNTWEPPTWPQAAEGDASNEDGREASRTL